MKDLKDNLSVQCGLPTPAYAVQETIASESESTQRDISAYLQSSVPKI